MDKFEKLEALISELKISDSELKNWYENRAQEIGGFIPTELPLVYRKGTEFTVENGLNLKRKEELWGIQLLSGVMVALMCGSGNNVSDTTWGAVKKFAEKMRLNGKAGFLPSKGVLKKHWGGSEEAKFAATVEVLKENEIEADGYLGCIWCSEEYIPSDAFCFSLRGGSYDWLNKNHVSDYDRVAVVF